MNSKLPTPALWDAETDVVVVGSGFAGLVAAAIARGRGAHVIVLEADDEIGGMMRISSGEYWVPNNACMQEAGIEDPKQDCLKLMARLSYPTHYDPSSPMLGLLPEVYRVFDTYYDTAGVAVAELDEIGAMGSVFSDGVTPDGEFNPQGHIEYHAELPENKVDYGRALMARTGGGHGTGQGQATIDLVAHAATVGIEIRIGHTFDGVYTNADGAVVGVLVRTDGGEVCIRARQGRGLRQRRLLPQRADAHRTAARHGMGGHRTGDEHRHRAAGRPVVGCADREHRLYDRPALGPGRLRQWTVRGRRSGWTSRTPRPPPAATCSTRMAGEGVDLRSSGDACCAGAGSVDHVGNPHAPRDPLSEPPPAGNARLIGASGSAADRASGVAPTCFSVPRFELKVWHGQQPRRQTR